MAEQQPSTKTRSATMRNLSYFDDRAALHLTQAFAQETELEGLLALLFAQLCATSDVLGLRYTYAPLGVDLNYGERDRHNADYDLTFRDAPIGKLTLYFREPQHEQSMQTCEDLLSMAFISLRNAVTIMELRNTPPSLNRDERAAMATIHTEAADTTPLPKEQKYDALILLALDDYPAIRRKSGEEWAQVLMSAVHEQVREGLRAADGVYHIGDDLIAILLPNTTKSQSAEVAEKVRLLVASLHLRGEITEQLTACMGLADSSSASTAEAVMANARSALAAAQARGSNQISMYQEPEVEDPKVRKIR